ncbi:hypothetical protein MO973_00670 [Paenibacillus sp. TRM 82003]|nr:hypothetical protein [Paenibacillus sp. TRM 82003]
MYYAVDSSNGSRVNASAPGIYRSGKYICPVCRAPVHLRKGLERDPYFAHNSGKAKPSCELYTPGTYDDGYYQNPTQQQTREPQHRTLNIYLKLIEESGNELNWALEVGIPEPDVNHGRIEIPFGWEGRRIIPLYTIPQGGRRVRIRPQLDSYNIVTDGVPEGRWKQRITQPIDGLVASDLTIFRYSALGGRRLSKDSPIYWGRSYIIMWTTGREPRWWPKQLLKKTLKSRGSLHGACIHIPVDRNHQTEVWVMEYLKHAVLHPPAELRLIAPPPEHILPDGSYMIKSGKKVFVGITGELGARKWNEINGYHWENDSKYSSTGTGRIPTQLELSLMPGRNDIWLDDGIEESLQIIVDKNTPDAVEIPGITLLAKGTENSDVVRVLLHSKEAETLIRDSYSCNIEYTDIDFPVHVYVYIKWKTSLEDNWNEEKFVSTDLESIPETRVKFISLLNKLIKEKVNYLTIEAGAYGRIDFEYKKSDPIRVLKINPAYSARVINLVKLSQVLKPLTPVNFKASFNLGVFSQQDQLALKKILSKKQWPISLLPQVNALLKEYQRLYQEHKGIGREHNGN